MDHAGRRYSGKFAFWTEDTAHGIRIRSRSRTYVCAWTAATQADFRAESKNLPPEETTVCVDHHVTTEFFCDYNYVEPEEAATGQIIFDLLGIMGAKPDKETERPSLPP